MVLVDDASAPIATCDRLPVERFFSEITVRLAVLGVESHGIPRPLTQHQDKGFHQPGEETREKRRRGGWMQRACSVQHSTHSACNHSFLSHADADVS